MKNLIQNITTFVFILAFYTISLFSQDLPVDSIKNFKKNQENEVIKNKIVTHVTRNDN
jgi:hypothetical protein